jgi:hypothetical protein
MKQYQDVGQSVIIFVTNMRVTYPAFTPPFLGSALADVHYLAKILIVEENLIGITALAFFQTQHNTVQPFMNVMILVLVTVTFYHGYYLLWVKM